MQAPVVKFRTHSPEYAATWEESARYRLEHAPVAWTEESGGHWVVSKHADAMRILQDAETFSSEHKNPEHPERQGIAVPPGPTRLHLSESDPPLHTALRMTEAPFFAPKALRKWEERANEFVAEALDAVIESGSVELVHDFAIPVTARLTMEIIGISLDHWKDFAIAAHEGSYRSRVDPLYPQKEAQLTQQKMAELLHERRGHSRGDIASAIANREINGENIGDEVGLGMLSAMIFGGFDTTVTGMLNALLFLEGKTEEHERLLTDDAYIKNATDEILRMWPPNHGLARNVTRDVEIRGITLRAGDRVQISWPACNRDPEKFADPERVWLDRPNASEHLSFSGGIHRCLGAPLARMEIRKMLRAVLTRVPDYRIEHDAIVRFPTIGSVAGYMRVPASFTPGRRSEPARE